MKKLSNSLSLVSIWTIIFMGMFILPGNLRAELAASDTKLIVSNSSNFIAKKAFLPGKDLIYLQLTAPDKNRDERRIDSVRLKLISALGTDSEKVILTETGRNAGVFQNERGIGLSADRKIIGDGVLQVASSEDIITVIFPENEKERVIGTVTSQVAVDSFSVITETVQIAGKPFPVKIIAKDKQGNPLTNYHGPICLEANYISPKEGKSKISPRKISSFCHGVAKIFVIYPDAGVLKITLKDINKKSGESKKITFVPAKFKLEAQTPQVVGKGFNLKITALNYNNEITPNYKRPVSIRPLRSDSSIKRKIEFVQGIAQTKIVYNNWGKEKFIICDREYRDVYGISKGIFFKPYRFEVNVDTPPKNRKKFYFEELYKGRVTVFDYRGKKIPEYAGIVAFEPVEDVDMPAKYYFDWLKQGEGNFYMSGVTEKKFRVKVYDVRFPEVKGESRLVGLMPAQVKIEPISSQPGKVSLRIKIVDKEGRVLSDDNSTIFIVNLIESLSDNSAALVGPKKLKARKGTVTITVADSQKETVTVIPESEPYLEAEPLDITFE